MRKTFIFLIATLALSTSLALAGNGRLAKDGNGTSMQGFTPNTQGAVASLGTGRTAVFQNVTVTGLAALKWIAATAAGVETKIKVRLGGFTTGAETDTFIASSDTIWVDKATTIGFHAYSTATNINLHTLKQ